MKAKSLPLNDNVKIRPSGGFFYISIGKIKKTEYNRDANL